jgi:biotin operon repressor
MPEFKYTAIDRSGQQATGKVDADSADDARKKLMAKGLMVTALSGDAGAPKPVAAAAAPSKGFRFGAKVTPDEVTTMARQLATLLTAGLPLLRALELIHKQERNLLFKDILDGELIVGRAPPKQEIARMIGASREMVSRVVKDLQERGYIRAEKRKVFLLDKEAMSKRASIN